MSQRDESCGQTGMLSTCEVKTRQPISDHILQYKAGRPFCSNIATIAVRDRPQQTWIREMEKMVADGGTSTYRLCKCPPASTGVIFFLTGADDLKAQDVQQPHSGIEIRRRFTLRFGSGARSIVKANCVNWQPKRRTYRH